MKKKLYVILMAAVMVAIGSCSNDENEGPNEMDLMLRTDTFSGRWSGEQSLVTLHLGSGAITVDSMPNVQLLMTVLPDSDFTVERIVSSDFVMRLTPYGKSSNAVLYQLSGGNYNFRATVNGTEHRVSVKFQFDPSSGSMAVYYGAYNSIDIKLQVVSVEDGSVNRSFIVSPLSLSLHATSVKK